MTGGRSSLCFSFPYLLLNLHSRCFVTDLFLLLLLFLLGLLGALASATMCRHRLDEVKEAFLINRLDAMILDLSKFAGPRIVAKHDKVGLAAGSASDFVCGILQLAAGMNLHVFTTGRGTPYGLAMAPVVKVSTRTELAQRWPDLIDIDAGRIATGRATIEELGWELFHFYLDVASGKKQTWAEHHKLHNDITLFNPAPIT